MGFPYTITSSIYTKPWQRQVLIVNFTCPNWSVKNKTDCLRKTIELYAFAGGDRFTPN